MKKILFWGKHSVTFTIALSSLAFVLPAWFYELDLLQSFAVHALAGYIGLALLLVIFRAWWWSAGAAGAALVLLVALQAYILPMTSSPTVDGHPFHRGPLQRIGEQSGSTATWRNKRWLRKQICYLFRK